MPVYGSTHTRSAGAERTIVLNVSFCDIKSEVQTVLGVTFFLQRLSTCDLRGNSFYGVIPNVRTNKSLLT